MRTMLRLLSLLLFSSLILNSCKKDDKEEDATTPTPTPVACNDDAHNGYTSLISDTCGDGDDANLLDGTRLEYRYDALPDSIWFLVTVNSVSSSQAIGVNILLMTPAITPTFNFWGNNNTDSYNRILTVWVTGNAPSTYTGVIGIGDADGVNGQNFTNLSQNNISINVNTADNTILLGLKRTDLLADSEFTGNTITAKIAAAVGSNQVWNDDIYSSSATISLTLFTGSGSVPSVTTSIPSNVTTSSADLSGSVTDDGGSTVTNRGFALATHPNPTIGDLVVAGGAGLGNFNVPVSGLSPGVDCYVRAFATNSTGTAYGNEVMFTTLTALPVVSTTPISDITTTTALTGGNVTDDGGGTITARGVVYATHTNPTISDFVVSAGTGTGTFSSNLSGLTPNTDYYVRAFATNSAGTAYGTDEGFTTRPILTTMPLDSIRLLNPGPGASINLPAGRKIVVTVSSNYTTNHINGQNMYVQDNTAGLMVRFTTPHSFAQGTVVEIDISGMVLTEYMGVLEIDLVPLSNATATGTATISPIPSTLNNLTVNYESLTARVVRVTNVTISGSGTYGGSNLLSDGSGNTFILFTPLIATFSGTAYPTGTVNITGILTQYNGTKELIIRSTSDVQ